MSARALAILCSLSMSACAGGEPLELPSGMSTETAVGGSTSSDGSASSEGGSGTGADESEGTAAESGASDCVDPPAPQLLSMGPVQLEAGAASSDVVLEFDREVTIQAGGLSIDGGATIVAPALPSTGASITVEVEGLAGPGPFTLGLGAASITDTACGVEMDADAAIEILTNCDGNVGPASTAVAFHQLAAGTASDVYELTFDEAVTLQAGAVTVSNGSATLDAISPALPASSDAFTVQLSNLGPVTTLSVTGASVSDGCGATLVTDVDLWVCTVQSLSFEYTGAAELFTIPACAQGQLSVVADGAQGASATGGGAGGLGARAVGELDVTTAEVLELYVGGRDGFNGGGAPGVGGPVASGSGGGATDVRQGGGALAQRVVVAGGGGGGSAPPQGSCTSGVGGPGGAGGGPDGTSGGQGSGCSAISTGGAGGDQGGGGVGGTAGSNCSGAPDPGDAGVEGVGGSGSDGLDCNGGGFTGAGGGGGGGGYFGGGGGAGGPGGSGGSWGGGGGGGGSSYVGGLLGGRTSEGVREGDGSITLSW